MKRLLRLALIGVLALIAFEALKPEPWLAARLKGDEWPRALLALGFTALVGATVISAFRGRLLGALGAAMLWTGLGFALVAGHAYRDEIRAIGERIWADLVPGNPVAVETSSGEKAVEIRRAANGYFALNADVNGASVPMLVDTGATHVTLTYEAAEAAGLDLRSLRFDVPVATANGVARAAAVTLDRVSVGPIARRRLRALVVPRGALNRSLLGMNFLETLASYEVKGRVFTMRSKS